MTPFFPFFPSSSQKEAFSYSYVVSIAGIIIEFISAVFFVQYSISVRQMKDYYAGLLKGQNILLSLKIIEDLKEDKVKAETISNLVRYLTKDTEVKNQ